MAEKEMIQQKKQKYTGTFRDYFQLIAEVMILVFFINAFLLQTYVIPTPSMENSMLIGDHLLLDKVSYSPFINSIDRFFLPQVAVKRGMPVAFIGPNELYRNQTAKNVVKRVIALPGETIKIIDNKVFINGKAIDEPYACFKGIGGIHDFPPEFSHSWHYEFPLKYRTSVVSTPIGEAFEVPEGHYFCMGDNRNVSFDSRYWGPLPRNLILGKPWRVYWSYASTSSDYLNMGFFEKVKDFFRTALNFFSKTRWERTFKKY